MKKTVSLIIAFIMVGLVFVACVRTEMPIDERVKKAQELELKNFKGETEGLIEKEYDENFIVATVGKNPKGEGRYAGVGIVGVTSGIVRIAIWVDRATHPEVGMIVTGTRVGYSSSLYSTGNQFDTVVLARPAIKK